ncbi:MAG: hypothetical protein ABI076_13155, partial [Acidobacteriaceae bacterium]
MKRSVVIASQSGNLRCCCILAAAVVFWAAVGLNAQVANHSQVANYVDPFLGIAGGGNTIPGPSLPFGMIKPGPDVGDNTANSGWKADGDINGFSQTHVSGTGGGPKYGNILVQPTTGEPSAVEYGSPRADERGTIGYYRVTLQRYGIAAEITAAHRAAIYRFTYPAAQQANILFDAGHFLTHNNSEGQILTASQVTVISPTEVSGSSSLKGGWNKQPQPYTVYFYAVSNTPANNWGTWRDGRLYPGKKIEAPQPGSKTGAWLTFTTHPGEKVLLKIGISFLSVDQAKRNLAHEISNFDFDRV